MAQAKILTEREGAVLRVTLNDPATRNSLTPELVAGLHRALVAADEDQTVSCVVLTGAGKGFCAGGNIKDMRDGNDPMFRGTPHEMQEGYRNGIQALPRLFNRLDVPVIAAVNGNAIGAGCDLACMCDIRVGASDTKFAESFMRVGLVSGDGGAWYLPRVVGLPRALEMALTCAILDAQEALAFGLVTHVVEPGALLDKAMHLAHAIAAHPPRSIRLNKRLLKRSNEIDLEAALELAASYQAIVQNTADQKEAVSALLEKRAPAYIGR
ncbi:enoyl-CoA hydratase-related protein [Paracoccus pantotrophus]|uniref:enoyl-CoA hydratase-related protein n=1 Tax=Paracoccus pantotrophus TaxID=82367 RepID=UPI000491F581|nr:enoyl-CoA hydratase-related protein [Paracoccus pantotrophus]